MDLLAKSDEEIYVIGKPFWENLVRSSNLKDYGGFTRDFSTQMLFLSLIHISEPTRPY